MNMRLSLGQTLFKLYQILVKSQERLILNILKLSRIRIILQSKEDGQNET